MSGAGFAACEVLPYDLLLYDVLLYGYISLRLYFAALCNVQRVCLKAADPDFILPWQVIVQRAPLP